MEEKLYTQEEVAEAVRRASAPQEGLRHSEVLAAATEAGISSERLEQELAKPPVRPGKELFSADLPFAVDPNHFPSAISDLPVMASRSAKMIGTTLTCYFEVGVDRCAVKISGTPRGISVRITPMYESRLLLTVWLATLGIAGVGLWLFGAFSYGLALAALSALLIGLTFCLSSRRKGRVDQAGRAIVARLQELATQRKPERS